MAEQEFDELEGGRVTDALRRVRNVQDILRRLQKDINVMGFQQSTTGKWEPTDVVATRAYLEHVAPQARGE